MRSRASSAVATAVAVVLMTIAAPLSAQASAAPARAAGAVLASDAMSRTVRSGLGTAPTGGAYTVSTGRSFSVSGGLARATVATSATSVSASLKSVSAADVDESLVFSLPQLPRSGGGIYLRLRTRQSATRYYQTEVRVSPSGQLALAIERVIGSSQVPLASASLSTRVTAGVPFTLETQITGTSPIALAAKVSNGSAGPSGTGWNLTVKDSTAKRITSSGAVGLGGYISKTSPGQSFAFDDLRAAVPSPPTSAAAQPNGSSGATGTTTSGAEPATDQPTWPTTGERASRGAAAIGSSAYPIPSDAIYVSPSGTSKGTGTLTSPYATLATAISHAPTGATLVLRAGTYHEDVTVPAGKALTIQPYPHEAVWLDGAQQVTGWAGAGDTWYVKDWDHVFDDSPTFTKGAADGTGSWAFVSAANPMAAHPDGVWVDGAPLQQVGSLAQVTSGTFFVDPASQRLYIGRNPAGHTVAASTLTQAMSIQGAGTTVRGIGFRHYATSVWMMGTVTVTGAAVTIANDSFYDNAATGLFVGAANANVTNDTVARNGLMGLSANQADGLVVDGLLSVLNNSSGFNASGPALGGMKVTRSRTISIRNSAFLENNGPGLWLDESDFDMTVSGDDSVGNAGNGVAVEISDKLVFVDNAVLNNGGMGVKVNDTGDALVWNNTIVGAAGALEVLQDSRIESNPSTPGHDPRRPVPDPTMPWLIRNISMGDNVIGQSTGQCDLCVEDYSHTYSASALNITTNGNLYQRTSSTQPAWVVIWQRSVGNPGVYATLTAFTSATGQDRRSVEIDGQAATSSVGSLLPTFAADAGAIAVPAPATVAALLSTSSPTLGAR